MIELLQNQELLLNAFKVVAFVFCLILVIILGAYNWLYLSKLLKSSDQVGIQPPQHVHHMVRTCIWIPFVTAVCICIFVLFRIY